MRGMTIQMVIMANTRFVNDYCVQGLEISVSKCMDEALKLLSSTDGGWQLVMYLPIYYQVNGVS